MLKTPLPPLIMERQAPVLSQIGWLANCVGSFLWYPLFFSHYQNRCGITREQKGAKAYFLLSTLSKNDS